MYTKHPLLYRKYHSYIPVTSQLHRCTIIIVPVCCYIIAAKTITKTHAAISQTDKYMCEPPTSFARRWSRPRGSGCVASRPASRPVSPRLRCAYGINTRPGRVATCHRPGLCYLMPHPIMPEGTPPRKNPKIHAPPPFNPVFAPSPLLSLSFARFAIVVLAVQLCHRARSRRHQPPPLPLHQGHRSGHTTKPPRAQRPHNEPPRRHRATSKPPPQNCIIMPKNVHIIAKTHVFLCNNQNYVKIHARQHVQTAECQAVAKLVNIICIMINTNLR